jgi:hypothetical protein
MDMDLALRVMRILVAHNCEIGIDIAIAMAQTWCIEDGLEEHELGLGTAADQGWIMPGTRAGTLQITQAGVAAATKDAH